ncbi:hypothetical protein Afil01_56200 [Actinorhabdospora filicis]|uniref:HEAT repeat domain-containing protein n=1 Tax=Actinorhabdospora filicis TaxID=1785913 RepID=A0A9W6WC81_9ACTN|nr:hypothetical protein Afil01_56200 [Actinorhabdospora filicis]
MLDGLDDIDWAKLSHAYGSAGDVPRQLRELASPDEETRHGALGELFANIYHQGTRYKATPKAVPFLWELAADPGIGDRDAILRLLALVTVGFDEQHLPGGFDLDELRDAARGGEALAVYGSRSWAKLLYSIHRAVSKGTHIAAGLLSDADAGVRCSAAYVLAWFPDRPGHVPALLGLASDPVDAVAATAIVAASLIGGEVPPALLDDERRPVRWAASVALAGTGDARAIAELTSWLSEGGEPLDVPFLEGNVRALAALALERAGGDVFDVLLDGLTRLTGTEALTVAYRVLAMAFPEPVAAGVAFGALPERQRRVVRALAHARGPWLIGTSSFGNFGILMRETGLPRTREEMAGYLSRG